MSRGVSRLLESALDRLALHPSEALSWLRTRWNRPPSRLDEASFWSLYERQGEPLRGAPEQLRRRAHTELLVVVTTYRRPEAVSTLLAKLHVELAALPPSSLCVLVLNDRSEADYGRVIADARERFGDALLWLDARARLGKPNFWRIYQVAFLAARALRPERALFLQDDVELAPRLLDLLSERWRATHRDPKRRVLYLFSSPDDERFGRWLFFLRRDVGGGLRLTQWFDLQAFYVDRAFFELLRHRVVPIHPNRWRRQPSISSGVGRQFTLRLRGRANVYQSYPPLVFHGAHTSELNAQARAARALDNRGLKRAEDEPR